MMKDKKMAESKIDFSFENLHFSCAGDNDWVEKQLNNVLNRIPALLSIHRKGENMVEDVIEVKAEDEREVTENAPESKFRAGKGLRDGIRSKQPGTVKVPKEKIAKGTKIKVAKTPKIAKAPKIKDEKAPESSGSVEPVKLVKKRGFVLKSAATKKEVKKKTSRVKPAGETIDSPLYQFLTEQKVVYNQVRKFLATAVFLARNNNVSKLSTPMISKALKSYGIEKLQNASDCLNKNEKKGYCIKVGKEFTITENGYLSML
ncbi:MAG: hypothetical protein WCP08_08575 [Prolixibacteraceae bacterium]